MDEITHDIDKVVNLLNVLKSRYFFLHAKYDVELKSQTTFTPKDILTEYNYASNDLQLFIMLELYLLEYACTYGIYSMNMYGTRQKTNLIENDIDHHFLKILKNNLRNLIKTNNEIKNLSVDSYDSFHSYINSFMVYANVWNEINISNNIQLNNTDVEKKKNKLLKKISKINLMSTIITHFVSNTSMDYRTDVGRATLNIALKYRTPRSLEYYSNKLNSNKSNQNDH